ncbi:hypothetical protein DFH09DRAFT_1083544 [Mycena vulgaris]|nr:hypothetical protein DFH09DRAFT_1083544 [Mycena vulgaris]
MAEYFRGSLPLFLHWTKSITPEFSPAKYSTVLQVINSSATVRWRKVENRWRIGGESVENDIIRRLPLELVADKLHEFTGPVDKSIPPALPSQRGKKVQPLHFYAGQVVTRTWSRAVLTFKGKSTHGCRPVLELIPAYSGAFQRCRSSRGILAGPEATPGSVTPHRCQCAVIGKEKTLACSHCHGAGCSGKLGQETEVEQRQNERERAKQLALRRQGQVSTWQGLKICQLAKSPGSEMSNTSITIYVRQSLALHIPPSTRQMPEEGYTRNGDGNMTSAAKHTPPSSYTASRLARDFDALTGAGTLSWKLEKRREFLFCAARAIRWLEQKVTIGHT